MVELRNLALFRAVSILCLFSGLAVSSGENLDVNEDALWARSQMPHPPNVPIAGSLPRISVHELNEPENQIYKERLTAFILTEAMVGWPALEKWPVLTSQGTYLTSHFPDEVCDFYPYNMLQQGTHPFLIRFRTGIKEMMDPPGRFTDGHKQPYSCENIRGCRYLHMQLTSKTWGKLEELGDIPRKRHTHLEGDKWWMRRCLQDDDVREEYHIKTHWKIILIGTKGSGMFNHSDSLMTASWHGHVQGKKWWYVCTPDGVHPQKCYESILNPGEVLYYGPGWYHATRNLDSPSMTVTGTVVHKYNFELIADKLYYECTTGQLQFDFSGKLCDALDKCYPLWHKYLKGHDVSPNRWRPWREAASAEIVKKKDAMRPTENNYDGRNHITE